MVRNVPTKQQQQDQGQTGNVPARMPASLKELKEMWKQYMKTPFSGQPPTRVPPSPKRECGLSHVMSLPTVKTPFTATAGWGNPMHGMVCRSNNSNSRPIPNMEDMLCIRACTTTRMTCAAMSKLYLHAGFHSRFTSHLGIVATLHRLILLQQPPHRHHWAKVIGRVLHKC